MKQSFYKSTQTIWLVINTDLEIYLHNFLPDFKTLSKNACCEDKKYYEHEIPTAASSSVMWVQNYAVYK